MDLLKTLINRQQPRGKRVLLPELERLYDGDLAFPGSPGKPYIVANFVTTLDGVISFKVPGQASGSAISGSNAADRFIMGLLRASADAVIVGAGTVHDVDVRSLWIPEESYAACAPLYAQFRAEVLRKPHSPLIVIVSGSGRLDLTRAIFQTPGVRTAIVTTAEGEAALTCPGAPALSNTGIIAMDAPSGRIDPAEIVRTLHSRYGVRLLLHEGGSLLFGQFLEAALIDELFLTISPQVAGHPAHGIRPGLAAVPFTPEMAPWFRIVTAKESGDHLFLRYGYTGPSRPASSPA